MLTMCDRLTIAALGANAGAGGAMMPLACDRIIVRDGVVLNPHYQTMGLHGSEYWTGASIIFAWPSFWPVALTRHLTALSYLTPQVSMKAVEYCRPGVPARKFRKRMQAAQAPFRFAIDRRAPATGAPRASARARDHDRDRCSRGAVPAGA
jgi:hypothetical protein